MKHIQTNASFDIKCNALRKTINTYAKRSNLTDTYLNKYALTLKLQQRNVDRKYLNIIKFMLHKSNDRFHRNSKISKPIKNRLGVI